VLTAIGLDHQPMFDAGKVQDKRANRMLAANMGDA